MSGMIIHFICRGNVFRSIIAEAYTNSLKLPSTIVLSSGTCANTYRENNAENFPKTLALLQKHGINQYAKDHYADNLDQELLDKSDIAICLNRRAYEEAVSSFTLPEKHYVWDVIDLGEEGRIATTEAQREAFSEDVYAEIVKNVDDFISTHLPSFSAEPTIL